MSFPRGFEKRTKRSGYQTEGQVDYLGKRIHENEQDVGVFQFESMGKVTW